MQTLNSIQSLRATIKKWTQQGMTLAFVPTMGNLHAGHLALIQAAKQKADKVIVSIFVNPTQFSEGEDFKSYPRTEQQDRTALISEGVDLLFLPTVEEIYYPDAQTSLHISTLADLHCGQQRKGHFSGVATIVCKLLNIVQPNLLFLGEKDFQQLAIIRLMIRDLNSPVVVESIKTMRETDGLAMSSRNGYLTSEQRQIAPKLYQALGYARDQIIQNELDFRTIERQQQQFLTSIGFEIDYFSICCANDLLSATNYEQALVILAAAKLGKPRLIDNVYLQK
ncbi:MAG: pantoate--beta-alanine ligase [Methylococcales bacterium]|nr:pantoate--beta-alanine ligase [Methylococcales bacterium]